MRRDAPDPVGALLGGLLPCKFREFLSQLRAKCVEEPEPEPAPQSEAQTQKLAGWPGPGVPALRPCALLQADPPRPWAGSVEGPERPQRPANSSSSWLPEPRQQSGVSEPCWGSPQCPSCQFLPDLR